MKEYQNLIGRIIIAAAIVIAGMLIANVEFSTIAVQIN